MPTPYRVHKSFNPGMWLREVEVRDFIQKNYTPYDGDGSFLAKPTKKTLKVWAKVQSLLKKEIKAGGVLDIDVDTPSSIISHKPGYIDKSNESIFGLQTDVPLKRAIKPKGGVRLVEDACEAYGYKLNPRVKEIFTKYQKTHNDGVFDIYKNWEDFYTPRKQMLRKTGLITGLPDNYGRGRIIGDYRRVPLYGIDWLVAQKAEDLNHFHKVMTGDSIRNREEIREQIDALIELKEMAKSYGFDIGRPAENFQEAAQWLYFGYLGAVKEQDGAAMSFGRVDAFLDIYAEKDLQAKKIKEEEIQQIVDDFIIKLRIVRHLRPPEYNELFAGDPTWITFALAGMGIDGRALATKTTYRILHTLTNLGPAPEPNMTVLWSPRLPENFKNYASNVSVKSSSIQFESDELMRFYHGDDYAIACCVSAMTVGKQMQFFGARCNLAKLFLLAINEGKDEITDELVVENVAPLKNYRVLDYEEASNRFNKLMKWLAKKYVDTMNVIHYMHDRYNYEKEEMALHDSHLHRFMAFGIAGLSIVTDSLSAIKHAKVTAIRDKNGVAKKFKIEGEFPCYGNDDDRVDQIAVDVCRQFIQRLREHATYRKAEHTLSVLTITSNVIYGKHTGATPDGREEFTPFAPGANPMHNRDKNGALAALNSVAKIPYAYCRDGISNTFSVTPETLGKNDEQRVNNLRGLLDGYFIKGGHHINVNVIRKEILQDAMKHPEKYPQLTIRVSGYAVNFVRLTKEQQKEVIGRTFHKNF